MGKTAFSGPAFGAKGTLMFTGPVAASTGSSAVFAGCIVPSGEDWYITEISLHRNSTGSTNFVVSVHDDSTLVGSVGVGGSSAAASGITVVTADAGEYAGMRVASGSTLTLSHSSHAGPNINVTAAVYGYPRWIPSTRAE